MRYSILILIIQNIDDILALSESLILLKARIFQVCNHYQYFLSNQYFVSTNITTCNGLLEIKQPTDQPLLSGKYDCLDPVYNKSTIELLLLTGNGAGLIGYSDSPKGRCSIHFKIYTIYRLLFMPSQQTFHPYVMTVKLELGCLVNGGRKTVTKMHNICIYAFILHLNC